MSEKRFIVIEDGVEREDTVIEDTITKERYNEYGVVELLNEQQATIRRLQDLCGESDSENAKLRIENKKLQREIKLLKPTNVEQYEQIVQLQEMNEQLKDDLHNCRLNKNIIREKLKLWQDVHKEYNIYNIKDFEELMKEKEEDEQLYANEIVKLNKEAKEVLDFKSLGGDY